MMKEDIINKLVSPYDIGLNNVDEFNGYYTSDSLKEVQKYAKDNNISIILDTHGDGSMFGYFSYLITEEDIAYVSFVDDDYLLDSIEDRDNIYKNYYQNIDKIESIKDKKYNLKLPLTDEELNILYCEARYKVLNDYYIYTSKIYEELIKGNKICIVEGLQNNK